MFSIIVVIILVILQFGVSRINRKKGVLSVAPSLLFIIGLLNGIFTYHQASNVNFDLGNYSVDHYVIYAILPWLIGCLICLAIRQFALWELSKGKDLVKTIEV